MSNWNILRKILKDQFYFDIVEYKQQIPGSKADITKIYNYDIDEIIKGIKVELEHTDRPMVALEIALAHLEEMKNYYTELEKMENKELNEDVMAGDVSTIDMPIGKYDGRWRDKPFFSINNEELRALVKKSEIPDRVKLFSRANKRTDVYMRHADTNMTFRLDNFFKLEDEEMDEDKVIVEKKEVTNFEISKIKKLIDKNILGRLLNFEDHDEMVKFLTELLRVSDSIEYILNNFNKR